MKKALVSVLALSVAVIVLSGCGSSNQGSKSGSSDGNQGSNSGSSDGNQAAAGSSRELNLFTWEGMFPQEVLDAFTAETGIKVNYSSFDTDETMLSKLQTAGGGDYDVVIADDYIIETTISQQLVQPLNKTKLDNWENINPVYQGQFFDPEDAYTVPYGAGVQTIVYNPGTVDMEIKGYADLWDESLKDNLAIIGNYRVINGMALKIAGESYNTNDSAVIAAAGEKLLELAPNVRLIKDDNVQDDLISGEVGVAVMYTSQVTMACLADPELKVVYPEEGIGFGIMAQFIPVNAPHAGEAHEFINYILRPEVAKQCFEYFGYYSTNRGADELISEEYRQFLTLPAGFDGNAEMIQNVDAQAEEAHVKVWTKFKSACGQ